MSAPVSVRLLGKPGCHLCADAREVVMAAVEAARDRGLRVEVEELNILDDPELARVHAEDIPVVFVAGRRHAIWRVDRARLDTAISKAARRPAWTSRLIGGRVGASTTVPTHRSDSSNPTSEGTP